MVMKIILLLKYSFLSSGSWLLATRLWQVAGKSFPDFISS